MHLCALSTYVIRAKCIYYRLKGSNVALLLPACFVPKNLVIFSYSVCHCTIYCLRQFPVPCFRCLPSACFIYLNAVGILGEHLLTPFQLPLMFFSANLCPSLEENSMNFLTQQLMQFFSVLSKSLLLNSRTHSLKHLSTKEL